MAITFRAPLVNTADHSSRILLLSAPQEPRTRQIFTSHIPGDVFNSALSKL